MIVEYIRRQGRIVGCMCASSINDPRLSSAVRPIPTRRSIPGLPLGAGGGYVIGFSLCRKVDRIAKFDKKTAIDIASVRYESILDKSKLPMSIIDDFREFMRRCDRYFSGECHNFTDGFSDIAQH